MEDWEEFVGGGFGPEITGGHDGGVQGVVFGPVWSVGDAVDDLGEDLFGAAGVGVKVTDDSMEAVQPAG